MSWTRELGPAARTQPPLLPFWWTAEERFVGCFVPTVFSSAFLPPSSWRPSTNTCLSGGRQPPEHPCKCRPRFCTEELVAFEYLGRRSRRLTRPWRDHNR